MIGACMRTQSLQSCLTLCDSMNCDLPGSSVHGDSPGKNTGVDCHSLLQGIFPVQGSNPCFLRLLHWRQILYCWATREALINCYFPSFSLAQFFLHDDSCLIFTLLLQTTKPLLRAALSVYLQLWVELHSCTDSWPWPHCELILFTTKSNHPSCFSFFLLKTQQCEELLKEMGLFVNKTKFEGGDMRSFLKLAVL